VLLTVIPMLHYLLATLWLGARHRVVLTTLGLLLLANASLCAQRSSAGLVASTDTLAPAAAPARSVGPASAETLTGLVLGPDGMALSGATAQLEGSREIAVTNADGKFILPVSFGQGPVHIICRYAGCDDNRLTFKAFPIQPVTVEMVKTVKIPLSVTGQVRDL
jgi:hypothetical protein